MFFRKAGRDGFVKRRASNKRRRSDAEARGLRRPKAGAVVESEPSARSNHFRERGARRL